MGVYLVKENCHEMLEKIEQQQEQGDILPVNELTFKMFLNSQAWGESSVGCSW